MKVGGCYDPGTGATKFFYPPATPPSITITLPATQPIQPSAPVIPSSFTTAIPEIPITWPTSHTYQYSSMEYLVDPTPVISNNSDEDSPMRTHSPSPVVKPSSSPVITLGACEQPPLPWQAWLSQPGLSRPKRRSISPSSEESAPKRLRHDDRSYTLRTLSAQSTAASPNMDSPPMQINLP